jgi:hypothetical protein
LKTAMAVEATALILWNKYRPAKGAIFITKT